ncbi:MAG: OprO/OprP family phosphate-selective porin [Planctomycetaceae bacterium]|nr:OprO/OprP family phosphate-selective porin [Planctomycetaceae bacterium]
MIAAIAGGLAASVALAQDQPVTTGALERALGEIAELRAQNENLARKVESLEARVATGSDWLTEERAAEIRAVVSDVLADGSLRTSLAGDGATAGYDKSKGFFLASADGNYSLAVKGELQFRWLFDRRDIGSETAASGSPSNTTDEDTRGFEFRRARITLTGNVIDPSWTYEVKMSTNRTAAASNNSYLDDAWIAKSLGDGFSMKAGQFPAPFLREQQQSAFGQLTVERSLVNEAFSIFKPQGVEISWAGDSVRVSGFYGDTFRANATEPYAVSGSAAAPFNSGAAFGVPTSQNTGLGVNPSDYSFAARAEWKPEGEWKQFRQASSFRGDAKSVLFGVAGYAQALPEVSNTNGATPDTMWSATADATFGFGGANLFAMGVYRSVTLHEAQPVRGGGSDDSLEQWGALVQGGMFMTDNVELYARYEIGDTDTDQYRVQATSLDANGENLSLATLGLNWWPEGTKNKGIKITGDFGYAFDPIVDFAASGAGWLGDYTESGDGTSDGQWVIRTQLQFVF